MISFKGDDNKNRFVCIMILGTARFRLHGLAASLENTADLHLKRYAPTNESVSNSFVGITGSEIR